MHASTLRITWKIQPKMSLPVGGCLKSQNQLPENWIFEMFLYRDTFKIQENKGYSTFLDSPDIQNPESNIKHRIN